MPALPYPALRPAFRAIFFFHDLDVWPEISVNVPKIKKKIEFLPINDREVQNNPRAYHSSSLSVTDLQIRKITHKIM